MTSMELTQSLSAELFAITAVVGSLLLFVFLKFGKSYSKKRLPPGPRPRPVLGNLGLFGPLLHHDFKKLADRYGPIVYVRLGSVDVIAISSPDLAEEVLRTKDHIFASRPRSLQGKLMTYDHASVAFAPYGPYWRHLRKVYTLDFMKTKRVQQLQNDRKAEVLRALGSVIEGCKDGKAIPIYHTLWNIVSSNICRMTFGKTFAGGSSGSFTDSETQVYEEIIRRMQEVLTVFVPGDFIPFLRHFDFFGSKKQMKEISQQMDEFLEKIIEDHVHTDPKPDAAANDEDKDLVDILLTWPALEQEKVLSRDTVKALLQEVLIAGTDTSTASLSWAFAELLKNPSTLKRAQEELDMVVGRERLVEETDLPSLPYLQAIVKENFRLHSAPLLVPHESLEASTLGSNGYYIPQNCRIFINVWAMGRDPNLWENPLEFNPGRFLNADIDTSGKNFKLLPFGSGRRSCPGRAVGLTMVEYSLAAMLHACNWALPDGVNPEELDMTETPGLMIQKKIPLDVVASPRLPVSVIFSSQ